MQFLGRVKQSLSLDLRSLAAYRMLLGIIVIADVLYRLPDLTNFYTDIGVIPRAIFVSEMAMPWSFSLHLANGSSAFVAILFGLHLLFGLFLIFGYKTRWAIIGAYVMTVSVHNRNWLVNNGGDDILRAILFFSIFLPLNRVFSVDSALREKTKDTKDPSHFSTWGLTFFLQAFLIYFVSYVLKNDPIWRRDFTAVFFSSRLDIFATPFGIFLRAYPGVQKVITFLSVYLEWLGPLALIFSSLSGRFWWVVRALVVVLFWGFHVGIILTMWIGVFPYTCLAMWTAFLPGPLWDRLATYFRRRHFGELRIYYDGDCNFCLKSVLLLREFFLLPEVPIQKAQDTAEIYVDMVRENSWVLINHRGEKFFRFDAMAELFRNSPVLCWFSPVVNLRSVRGVLNEGYKWVANHRQLFSRFTQYLVFTTDKKLFTWVKWIYQLAGAFFFLVLLAWNLSTIKTLNFKSPFLQSVARIFHLYQEWNMFAPFPKMDNVWVEVPGILSDGSEIELLSGDRDIYGIKAEGFPGLVRNEHWRKFYLNLPGRNDYARYYGGYLCREWNERGLAKIPGTTLRKMEIIVFSQLNLPNGDKGGISRVSSWKHWCFDEDYKRENGHLPR